MPAVLVAVGLTCSSQSQLCDGERLDHRLHYPVPGMVSIVASDVCTTYWYSSSSTTAFDIDAAKLFTTTKKSMRPAPLESTYTYTVHTHALTVFPGTGHGRQARRDAPSTPTREGQHVFVRSITGLAVMIIAATWQHAQRSPAGKAALGSR